MDTSKIQPKIKPLFQDGADNFDFVPEAAAIIGCDIKARPGNGLTRIQSAAIMLSVAALNEMAGHNFEAQKNLSMAHAMLRDDADKIAAIEITGRLVAYHLSEMMDPKMVQSEWDSANERVRAELAMEQAMEQKASFNPSNAMH